MASMRPDSAEPLGNAAESGGVPFVSAVGRDEVEQLRAELVACRADMENQLASHASRLFVVEDLVRALNPVEAQSHLPKLKAQTPETQPRLSLGEHGPDGVLDKSVSTSKAPLEVTRAAQVEGASSDMDTVLMSSFEAIDLQKRCAGVEALLAANVQRLTTLEVAQELQTQKLEGRNAEFNQKLAQDAVALDANAQRLAALEIAQELQSQRFGDEDAELKQKLAGLEALVLDLQGTPRSRSASRASSIGANAKVAADVATALAESAKLFTPAEDAWEPQSQSLKQMLVQGLQTFAIDLRAASTSRSATAAVATTSAANVQHLAASDATQQLQPQRFDCQDSELELLKQKLFQGLQVLATNLEAASTREWDQELCAELGAALAANTQQITALEAAQELQAQASEAQNDEVKQTLSLGMQGLASGVQTNKSECRSLQDQSAELEAVLVANTQRLKALETSQDLPASPKSFEGQDHELRKKFSEGMQALTADLQTCRSECKSFQDRYAEIEVALAASVQRLTALEAAQQLQSQPSEAQDADLEQKLAQGLQTLASDLQVASTNRSEASAALCKRHEQDFDGILQQISDVNPKVDATRSAHKASVSIEDASSLLSELRREIREENAEGRTEHLCQLDAIKHELAQLQANANTKLSDSSLKAAEAEAALAVNVQRLSALEAAHELQTQRMDGQDADLKQILAEGLQASVSELQAASTGKFQSLEESSKKLQRNLDCLQTQLRQDVAALESSILEESLPSRLQAFASDLETSLVSKCNPSEKLCKKLKADLEGLQSQFTALEAAQQGELQRLDGLDEVLEQKLAQRSEEKIPDWNPSFLDGTEILDRVEELVQEVQNIGNARDVIIQQVTQLQNSLSNAREDILQEVREELQNGFVPVVCLGPGQKSDFERMLKEVSDMNPKLDAPRSACKVSVSVEDVSTLFLELRRELNDEFQEHLAAQSARSREGQAEQLHQVAAVKQEVAQLQTSLQMLRTENAGNTLQVREQHSAIDNRISDAIAQVSGIQGVLHESLDRCSSMADNKIRDLREELTRARPDSRTLHTEITALSERVEIQASISAGIGDSLKAIPGETRSRLQELRREFITTLDEMRSESDTLASSLREQLSDLRTSHERQKSLSAIQVKQFEASAADVAKWGSQLSAIRAEDARATAATSLGLVVAPSPPLAAGAIEELAALRQEVQMRLLREEDARTSGLADLAAQLRQAEARQASNYTALRNAADAPTANNTDLSQVREVVEALGEQLRKEFDERLSTYAEHKQIARSLEKELSDARQLAEESSISVVKRWDNVEAAVDGGGTTRSSWDEVLESVLTRLGSIEAELLNGKAIGSGALTLHSGTLSHRDHHGVKRLTGQTEEWLRMLVSKTGDAERRLHTLEKSLPKSLRNFEETFEDVLSQLTSGVLKMAQLLGVAAEDVGEKLSWREICADLPRMMDHAWLRSRLPKRGSVLKILRQKADAEQFRQLHEQVEHVFSQVGIGLQLTTRRNFESTADVADAHLDVTARPDLAWQSRVSSPKDSPPRQTHPLSHRLASRAAGVDSPFTAQVVGSPPRDTWASTIAARSI